jgi:hypothetical protein
MKLERLDVFAEYGHTQTQSLDNGEYIEWNTELQELADRDEPMKVNWRKIIYNTYAYCSNCQCDENIYGEDGVRNTFCGNCGQRLNWK